MYIYIYIYIHTSIHPSIQTSPDLQPTGVSPPPARGRRWSTYSYTRLQHTVCLGILTVYSFAAYGFTCRVAGR